MCVNPRKVQTANGLAAEVACRNCWQCRSNRINDWVGRCIAERKTSVAASVITLTYGKTNSVDASSIDDLAAHVMFYSDVQKWLKRIRAAGYPARYFLAGEKGALKGRVHWHAILFWQGRVPNYMLRVKNWDDQFWHHGHTFWDDFDEKSAAYVCKYVMKDDSPDEPEPSLLRMSKIPPLGAKYFELLARRYAEARLLPADGKYSFGDIIEKKTGKPRQFMLHGRSNDLFCQALIDAWMELHGEHPLDRQSSPYLEAYMDRVAPRVVGEQLVGRKWSNPDPPPDPPPGYQVRFSEVLNMWLAEEFEELGVDADGVVVTRMKDGGNRLFWDFNREGIPEWVTNVIGTAAARTLREASTARKLSERDPGRSRAGTTLAGNGHP